jgi:hypothetical protein
MAGPWKGKSSKSGNPKSVTDSERCFGRFREEESAKRVKNPEDAAYPGEANPGQSLPDSESAVGKKTLERRGALRWFTLRFGHTPKGS